MRRTNRPHLLANLILAAHYGFMALVAMSWALPFRAQMSLLALLAGVTLLTHLCGDGRCPLTMWEYHVRWAAGHDGPPVGAMRRLLCRQVSEAVATGIAYGVAVEALLVGVFRALVR